MKIDIYITFHEFLKAYIYVDIHIYIYTYMYIHVYIYIYFSLKFTTYFMYSESASTEESNKMSVFVLK